MIPSDENNEQDLTQEERDAFAALPRRRIPPAALEDRVVAALRGKGLLVQPERRTRRGWIAAAAAAGAITFFASGLAVGQWMGGQSTARLVSAVLEQDAMSRALAVQAAGSEYVRAVAHLSDPSGTGEGQSLDPGREAARVALHAAALELGRLSPDDRTIQLVLAVLERGGDGGEEDEPAAVRQTIWF